MRVFNRDKTIELKDYDLEYGHLDADKLITHHPEIKEVKEQGHREVIREYPNGGRDTKWVVDVAGVPYQPAHDEIEEILVYIPYTAEELEEIEKDKLRQTRRAECFEFYNRRFPKGYLTEEMEIELDQWYYSWLDVTETRIIPQRPSWLK